MQIQAVHELAVGQAVFARESAAEIMGLPVIGFPDFEWKEFKVLGEFDGFEKYSAQRFLKGKTPSQVVVEEKRWEDRLRALGYTVVRWVWSDLWDPRILVDMLHMAGLPSA
ncbi:hypothetical protein [Arthrobacter sp. GMC3]|uniref:hypothetical protein n=1 Tax=Arthrobacter sp. GMC3 TaxID=2058894 RepID=UPI000CE40B41|nr:hypothetical protein [Arthrobacter sp. GMC3]